MTWVDISAVTPQPATGWSATQSGGTWAFTAPAGPAAPTLAQQAQLAQVAGVQITSTSTPALNGTYACDDEARADLMAEMLSFVVTQKFTNGTTTLQYADLSGTFHSFSPAEFQAFAVAVGAYIGALKAITVSNSGTLPAQPVVIA